MRQRDDDAVGYGKPPKRTRFKKGQSGNPRGYRWRRPKDARTILNDILDRKISVVEAGVSRRASLREVIITQLAAQAAKGNFAALNHLLEILEDARSRGELPALQIKFVPDDAFEKMSMASS